MTATAIHRLIHELATLRREAGLTQQQMADRLHVSRAAVGLFETRKRGHNLSTIEAYAEALGAEVVLRVKR